MEIVYGIVGFILLICALSWYQTKKYGERKRREELYTVTISELIQGLKKCDLDRKVIIADLKYADYDLGSGNLLLDLVWPEK